MTTAPAGPPDGRAPPWMVAVVTRDRPEAALRAVSGFVENLRSHQREAELFVADDSAPEAAARLRAGLCALAGDPARPVRYAGREARNAFIAALGEEGIDPEIARFALSDVLGVGVAIGVNRNSVMLGGVDARVASYDDDIVCRPVVPPGVQTGARLYFGRGDGYDHYSPGEYWFYRDRASLLSDTRVCDVDILASHDAVLGRTAHEIAPDIDVADALDLDLAARALAGRCRVVASLQGNYGDVGWYAATWLMMVEGASRERLMRTVESYRNACHASRELMRAVTRVSLTEGRFLQAGLLALDLTQLVAPFIPVGRYEDGVLRITQRAIDPDGLFAQVPLALLHDPVETRAFRREDIWRTGSWVRIGETIVQCVRAFASKEVDPSARARALGAHLVELGHLPVTELAHFLRGRFAAQKALYVAHYEALLARYGGLPLDWAEDVQRHIATTREAQTRPGYVVPTELGGDGTRSMEEGLAALGRLLVGFGQLIAAWPDLREATRRLRARGIVLGGPP